MGAGPRDVRLQRSPRDLPCRPFGPRHEGGQPVPIEDVWKRVKRPRKPTGSYLGGAFFAFSCDGSPVRAPGLPLTSGPRVSGPFRRCSPTLASQWRKGEKRLNFSPTFLLVHVLPETTAIVHLYLVRTVRTRTLVCFHPPPTPTWSDSLLVPATSSSSFDTRAPERSALSVRCGVSPVPTSLRPRREGEGYPWVD